MNRRHYLTRQPQPVVAALRGVGVVPRAATRAARGGSGTLAAAAFARHPSPLTANATATLHGYATTPSFSAVPLTLRDALIHQAQDPFLNYVASVTGQERFQLPANVAYNAAANAALTAAAVSRSYAAAAAAAAANQTAVPGYAAVGGFGREYAEPYLGHSIGPVTGYGVREFIIDLLFINKDKGKKSKTSKNFADTI